MERINKAISMAVKAHHGQERWGGTPYIVHPFRVAMRLCGWEENYVIAALLHDVVEDTYITLGQVKGEFGTVVADAVDALTRRPNEQYFDYVSRCIADPIAKQVKRVDLEDNIRSADGQRHSLTERYEKSLQMIDG